MPLGAHARWAATGLGFWGRVCGVRPGTGQAGGEGGRWKNPSLSGERPRAVSPKPTTGGVSTHAGLPPLLAEQEGAP